MLPQVKEIRQQFFGRADRPFVSWSDAEAWLTQTSEKSAFESACQQLTEATGLTCGEVERYILLGVEPYMSHVEVTLQSFAYHTRGQISLHWSFTDEDVRRATRAVRKALGVSRLKGITKSDQALLELMNHVGPPPRTGAKGQKAYWERVRLQWNADENNKPYPPGRALEVKYKRLQSKLNRLMPSHPATSATPST